MRPAPCGAPANRPNNKSNMTRTLSIDGRSIGPPDPAFIIAEIGVNHNGSLSLAKEMIDTAKDCGADCVKFQTFRASRVVSPAAPKSAYQLQTTDPGQSQLDMLKGLELEEGDWAEIIAHCAARDVRFLSTPYNFEDADLLERLGVGAYKIASGQAVEHAFLAHVAAKGKPVLLSTGMCTLAEAAFAARTLRNAGNRRFAVLQCTTNYPAAPKDANLRAMVLLGKALNAPFGYSDHTTTSTSAIAAVALGACIVERHFTLDKGMEGPDHSSSSDPEEFRALVSSLREVEACLGSGEKTPCEAERKNAPGMRRSLFAARDIAAGETLDWTNMIFQRPGTGIAGAMALAVPGSPAAKDIAAGTMLDIGHIAAKQG